MRRLRYLTLTSKDRELAYWRVQRDEFLANPPEGRAHLGGLGYPDPEIFEWCDRINALPGICTLQSCCGHIHPDGGMSSGNLWLWFSEPVSVAFDRHAMELARQPCCRDERVRRIYHDNGQEIADLTFKGMERGEPQFRASMETIVLFLRQLLGIGRLRRANGRISRV